MLDKLDGQHFIVSFGTDLVVHQSGHYHHEMLLGLNVIKFLDE
jgi:hypothetical protein